MKNLLKDLKIKILINSKPRTHAENEILGRKRGGRPNSLHFSQVPENRHYNIKGVRSV